MLHLFEHSKKAHELLDKILHNTLVRKILPYIIILSLSVYLIIYKHMNKNFMPLDRSIFFELARYSNVCKNDVSLVYRTKESEEWKCYFYYHIACDDKGYCEDNSRDTKNKHFHRESCDIQLYQRLRELGQTKENCLQIPADSIHKNYKNLSVYLELNKEVDLITKCILVKDTLGEPVLIFARSGNSNKSQCSLETDIKFSKSLIFNLIHSHIKNS